MNKTAAIVLLCTLLVILELYSVVSFKANEAQFKMRINERGTRFTEKIRVNEIENTILFTVPKHNNVNRSEVLNDFKLGLTITRVPDVGMCHIKPLEKNLPNPGKLKADMNFIKHFNISGGKPVVSTSSSKWTIDRQLETKYLKPSVAKFCGDLPVYSLKEITENGLEVMQGNDTGSRRQRRGLTIQLCPEALSGVKNQKMICNPNHWIWNCKFDVAGTCVYFMKCKVPAEFIKNNITNCEFTHRWNSVMCCIPICSSGVVTRQN
ncbi:uncharacterized protein LOC114530759 [Dendronephthya gigantea]|uniref:uncharacterized protein LOC114530759 n=1 Tax=Dendronephthya gigantea TaxID=151771 RepID=UPI00106B1E11|nr:uncharacterized protein LOC114530759 [Dendronephthya gigantea]